MITTSTAWKEYVKDSSIFHIKATMTGGSTLQLTDSDFMMGSVSFTDSMSGMNKIALGAVVTNSFNATLNNTNGRFDNWTWTTIDVWFGVEVNGTTEWIKRGKYLIDRPSSIGSTVKIECYDYMDKLNKYFNGFITTTFPVTYKSLIQAICTACGVTFGTWSTAIPNENVTALVASAFDESTTCRQVVSWLLETVGGYARINPVTNALDCLVWNTGHWGSADAINGGVFQTWNATTGYDGGTMNPWSVVTDRNGGLIAAPDYSLEKVKQQTIMIDDVEVTGIRAYVYQSNDEVSYGSAGTTGYILNIKDNPFVNDGNKTTIASMVWTNVQGFKVRPFQSSIFGDPSIEAGDTIILHDLHTDTYHVSLITSLTFNLGGDMRVSCDVNSPDEQALEWVEPQKATVRMANEYADGLASDLRTVIDGIETQVDAKIETWYQDTSPASAWTTSALKLAHKGDIWHNYSTDKTYRWSGSAWQEIDGVPQSVIDDIDGKRTIFYGSTSGTYTDVQVNDYLVDPTTGSTYRYQSATPHWVKVTDYASAITTYDTGLNQQKVYNKLTNNGQAQGLFLDPNTGDLYVNASWLSAGTITADVRLDIGTSSSTNDVIKMTYDDGSSSYVFVAQPAGLYLWQNGAMNFSLENLLGTPIFSIRDSTNTPMVSLNGLGAGTFKSTVTATQFINSSSADVKKSIEPLKDSALEKIKNADILSYNYKDESKSAKKHIGLVIDDTHNTPSEIIGGDEENPGVDLYAMVSLAWKAIQEQNEKIEALEKRVAELESLNEKKEK